MARRMLPRRALLRQLGWRAATFRLTLAQMLVANLLLAPIAALAWLGLRTQRIECPSPQGYCAIDFVSLKAAIDHYRRRTGRAPDVLEDLITPPRGLADRSGPFVDPLAPRDPWGRPYIYTPLADGAYMLRSFGADGRRGGAGENADVVRCVTP